MPQSFHPDVNVKKIQRLMGHSDIKMTLRYIHPDDDTLRAAVEKTKVERPENVPGAGRDEGEAASPINPPRLGIYLCARRI